MPWTLSEYSGPGGNTITPILACRHQWSVKVVNNSLILSEFVIFRDYIEENILKTKTKDKKSKYLLKVFH